MRISLKPASLFRSKKISNIRSGKFAKGTAIVAVSAGVCGSLAPVGLFIGGAVGGLVSTLWLKYEPLPTIYSRMTSDEKQKFVDYMRTIFEPVWSGAVAGLLPWVKSKGDGYNEIAKVLMSFSMEKIQDA